MSSVFTSFVGSLADAETPTPEVFERLFANLRRALVHELRRRSLWHQPPSHLGVTWGQSWNDQDLLEDLVLDCYQFIFIQRLSALMKQSQERSNIDGLIFRNIRNFLHEMQRRHDPLGYRLFELLHTAIHLLLEDGSLHLQDEGAKVCNQTILTFSLLDGEAHEAPASLLMEEVGVWANELMPEMITAWGKSEISRELASRIQTLPQRGISSFRFQDMVDALKNEVRARWQAISWNVEGEMSVEDDGSGDLRWVKSIRPDLEFEEREHFQALITCVEDRIDHAAKRQATRDYLNRLWFFVRAWVAELEPERAADLAEAAELLDHAKDRFPAHKPLAERLHIPRARIPELLSKLGELMKSCGLDPGTSAAEPTQTRQERTAKRQTRQAELRAQTLDLAARLRSAQKDKTPKELPKLGEVYLFDSTRAWPVAWLVLDHSTNHETFLVAPVDPFPTLGGGDLRPVKTQDHLHEVARLKAARWTEASRFEAPLLSHSWSADDRERAQAQQALLKNGSFEASASAKTIDEDPHYRSWMDEVQNASRTLGAEPKADVLPFEKKSERSSTAGSLHLLRSVAAAFALATLGLAFWLNHLQQEWHQERNRPRMVQIADESFETRRSDRGASLEWSGGDYLYHLLLSDPEIFIYPSYRFEIFDPEGELFWQSEILEERFSFPIFFPEAFLEEALDSGTFEVRIFGIDEQGTETALEPAYFRVQTPKEDPF